MNGAREIERPSVCGQCGGAIPPHVPGSCDTGYARTADGLALCLPCAHGRTLAEWNATQPGEGFVAYLSGDGHTLTTWPGEILARVTWRTVAMRYTPTGGAYEWHSIRARDAAGRAWYGGGPGFGMYCRVKPNRVTK